MKKLFISQAQEKSYMDDVSIVGGGIAGLYSAYQLINRYPNLRISIYEALPFLGGRIQTQSFCNGKIISEFGAHKIDPEIQSLTTSLIKELDLTTIPIAYKKTSGLKTPIIQFLTSEEKQIILDNQNPSLSLIKFALKKILGEQWDIDNDNFEREDRNILKRALRLNGTYNEIPLHQQGIWNVLSEVLSYEACDFLREKSASYNMKNVNQNAADWINLLVDICAIRQAPFKLKDGMATLITALKDILEKKGISVKLQQKITKLKEIAPGIIELEILNGKILQKINTKRVILAIPKASLLKLSSSLPEKIRNHLTAVEEVSLTWITCISEINKSTLNNFDLSIYGGDQIPVRMGFFEIFKDSPTKLISQFYCDYPWTSYWSALTNNYYEEASNIQQIKPILDPERLKNPIVKMLETVFPIIEPKILEWGIREWGREPFCGGKHVWKAKVQSEKIMKKFEIFSLISNQTTRNIHICGEAYSSCQGYIEGALLSVERVLRSIEK